MKKKLILVASPPASGKTYVSEKIAEKVKHIVYLDKDDLCDLIRAAFAASGNEVDMDGEFYINNLRPAEYSTILGIAFSVLRFADTVILNAPFGSEVRNTEYMRTLKEKANQNEIELFLVWVSVAENIRYERMKQRNSDRDFLKLQNWEKYAQKINFNPPYELQSADAVDKLIIFNNDDEASFKKSLDETLKSILEG